MDKVDFTFEARRANKYRIQYSPGYVNKAKLVKVYVNGEYLRSVPVTYNRWSDEPLTMDIPEQLLKIGGNEHGPF